MGRAFVVMIYLAASSCFFLNDVYDDILYTIQTLFHKQNISAFINKKYFQQKFFKMRDRQRMTELTPTKLLLNVEYWDIISSIFCLILDLITTNKTFTKF